MVSPVERVCERTVGGAVHRLTWFRCQVCFELIASLEVLNPKSDQESEQAHAHVAAPSVTQISGPVVLPPIGYVDGDRPLD